MKRSKDRERERGRKRGVDKETKGSLSFSFVSLESFPLPPLEKTAAPATHKQTLIELLSENSL